MSDNIFKDFIPANEDPGAVGSGYKDFVPPREPKVVAVPQEESVTPIVDEPLVPEVDETPVVEEAPKKEKK